MEIKEIKSVEKLLNQIKLKNIDNEITENRMAVFNALQKNKEHILVGLEDKSTMDALKLASLNPENSEHIKGFLIAALNTLKKMKEIIKEQETITKGKLEDLIKLERGLTQEAIYLLEPAIHPDERLDLNKFKLVLKGISNSFEKIQRHLKKSQNNKKQKSA